MTTVLNPDCDSLHGVYPDCQHVLPGLYPDCQHVLPGFVPGCGYWPSFCTRLCTFLTRLCTFLTDGDSFLWKSMKFSENRWKFSENRWKSRKMDTVRDPEVYHGHPDASVVGSLPHYPGTSTTVPAPTTRHEVRHTRSPRAVSSSPGFFWVALAPRFLGLWPVFNDPCLMTRVHVTKRQFWSLKERRLSDNHRKW